MKFIIGLFCLVFASSAVNAQLNIDLCDTVKLGKYNEIPVVVGPSQIRKGYSVEIEHVIFQITVNDRKRVHFVSTRDSGFVIGTLAVGTAYEDIPKVGIESEQFVDKWGYEVSLKNGWVAVFDDNLIFKSQVVRRDSRIHWFYKHGECANY